MPVRLKPGFPLTGTQNKGEGQQQHTVKPAGHLGTMIRLSPIAQPRRQNDGETRSWPAGLEAIRQVWGNTTPHTDSYCIHNGYFPRYHIFPPFSLYFRPFFVVRVHVCLKSVNDLTDNSSSSRIIALVCDNKVVLFSPLTSLLCTHTHKHTNKHAHSDYIAPRCLLRLQSAKFMSSYNDSQSFKVMENPYYPISLPADELIHKKVHITLCMRTNWKAIPRYSTEPYMPWGREQELLQHTNTHLSIIGIHT